MILLLLAQAAPPSLAAERYERCVLVAAQNPDQGEQEANAWRMSGGGYPARRCLGLAYAARERWLAAAEAFEQAAREAQRTGDGMAAAIWAQSGNALLAGGAPDKARAALDEAIGLNILGGTELGEARLDRARALVGAGDLPAARIDLDLALALVERDPLAWLLSATLARRMDDVPRAAKDIAEAQRLAPDDATVRLEAGNIAALSGDEAGAKAAWTAAMTVQPGSEAAKRAAAALAQFAPPARP